MGSNGGDLPLPPLAERELSPQALSHCRFVHPLHTGSANIFGASVSEATVRPDPRSEFEGYVYSMRSTLDGGKHREKLDRAVIGPPARALSRAHRPRIRTTYCH